MFSLHSQLQEDCIELRQLELCRLLLMNDASYPWFILVPARPDISEIFQLSVADRQLLMEESCRLGEFLMHEFAADKINVAALGNVVPQLHIHHIARYRHDRSWPAPVWGQHAPQRYEEQAIDDMRQRMNGFS